jgi:hypothetical protein
MEYHRLRRSLGVAILLLWLFSRASSAAAQAPSVSLDASQVRVTTQANSRPILGRVERIAHDTLYVDQVDSVLPLVIGSITRVEVYRGKHARTWRGVLIGALVGVGVGVVAAIPEDKSGLSTGERRSVAAWNFGLLGALTGAIVGAFSHAERWDPVPLENFAPIEVTPTDERAEVKPPEG